MRSLRRSRRAERHAALARRMIGHPQNALGSPIRLHFVTIVDGPDEATWVVESTSTPVDQL